MAEILGLDAKVITGFDGTPGAIMAMGRGEIDYIVTMPKPEETNSGLLKPLFVLGDQKSATWPDLPTAAELGIEVAQDLRVAYLVAQRNGKAIFTPPNVPMDRVTFLRGIFDRLNENKDARALVAKISGEDNDFIPGERLQQIIAEMKGETGLKDQMINLFEKYSRPL
jgi:tripartite-type tricarboxylate transporter receptor subunit TctC